MACASPWLVQHALKQHVYPQRMKLMASAFYPDQQREPACWAQHGRRGKPSTAQRARTHPPRPDPALCQINSSDPTQPSLPLCWPRNKPEEHCSRTSGSNGCTVPACGWHAACTVPMSTARPLGSCAHSPPTGNLRVHTSSLWGARAHAHPALKISVRTQLLPAARAHGQLSSAGRLRVHTWEIQSACSLWTVR